MTNQTITTHQLRRSRKNRMLFGVCGGLAEFFGIDVFWFRLLVVLAALPGGLPIWPYLLLVLIVPSE